MATRERCTADFLWSVTHILQKAVLGQSAERQHEQEEYRIEREE